jgi:hypothetical protein
MLRRALLPILIAALAAVLLVEALRATVAVVDANWRLRALHFLALYLAVFAVIYVANAKLFSGYWALLRLEPSGKTGPLENDS